MHYSIHIISSVVVYMFTLLLDCLLFKYFRILRCYFLCCVFLTLTWCVLLTLDKICKFKVSKNFFFSLFIILCNDKGSESNEIGKHTIWNCYFCTVSLSTKQVFISARFGTFRTPRFFAVFDMNFNL